MYSSIWIKESCARHTSFIQIIRQRFALIFSKSCHLLPQKIFKHHFNPLKIMSRDSIYFLYQEYTIFSKFFTMHLLPLSKFRQYIVPLSVRRAFFSYYVYLHDKSRSSLAQQGEFLSRNPDI